MWMIVIGSDPHKTNFAFGAVVAATGELRSSEAVKASTADFDRVLRWARKLDVERVWAIADCRHVSGPLERFLLARGERIVRVPPKLMAGARQGARQRGQSDRIDAIAVARAALAEGGQTLPGARLEGPELGGSAVGHHHDDQGATRPPQQAPPRRHPPGLPGP